MLHGPGSLADAVESEPPPTARALQQSAVALRGAVDEAVAVSAIGESSTLDFTLLGLGEPRG